MGFDQQRVELPPLPFATADRERTQRSAMIALASSDNVSSLWLAAFYEYCRASLSAASIASDPPLQKRTWPICGGAWAMRSSANSSATASEKAGVRVSQFVELLVHGGKNIWMRVPQTGNRRAARSIDIFLAGAVKNPDADARSRRRSKNGRSVDEGSGTSLVFCTRRP